MATTEDLAFAGIADQAGLLRSGGITSRQLLELYLGRIERLDPQLNAYRVVLAEQALAEADEADSRRANGEEAPLLGVPVAIKDNVDLASDGGGSIRIPAGCCGLFGLKPQRGRVSLMPAARHWHGLSVAGCVSRTVLDSALFYDVVRGPSPGDAASAPEPPTSFVDAAGTLPRPLRIAVSTKPIQPGPVAGEVKDGVRA